MPVTTRSQSRRRRQRARVPLSSRRTTIPRHLSANAQQRRILANAIPEYKNLDLYQSTPLKVEGTTWTVLSGVPLNCPQQGDASNEREGRKFRMTSLNVKFNITLKGRIFDVPSTSIETFLTQALPDEAIRIVILLQKDHGNSTGVPDITGWYQNFVTNTTNNAVDIPIAPFHQRRRLANTQNYKVLMDKIIPLRRNSVQLIENTTSGTQQIVASSTAKMFQKTLTFKNPIPVTCSGKTGHTFASISSNSICMYATSLVGDGTAWWGSNEQMTCQWSTRLRFVDV